jgi:hypothetical protein
MSLWLTEVGSVLSSLFPAVAAAEPDERSNATVPEYDLVPQLIGDPPRTPLGRRAGIPHQTPFLSAASVDWVRSIVARGRFSASEEFIDASRVMRARDEQMQADDLRYQKAAADSSVPSLKID